MKSEIRILGIDDAPFSFTDSHTDLIGVVMRGNHYIEGVLYDHVTIDGTDATRICEDMITRTRHYQQLKAVLFDGATLGGFNVLDIETIWENTHVPVITVTRKKPDFEKINNALKNHFSDWEKRRFLLEKGTLHLLKTNHNPLFIKCEGVSLAQAKEIITLATIRGVIPEPIRVAHIIASGISRGESYGKA
ncbi:MAG: DUF99 family protein [Candidatus Thermoplasmatota archaeon]|nr:DUF99 family protein [Candidatus Thermoplasmatota archaeon]